MCHHKKTQPESESGCRHDRLAQEEVELLKRIDKGVEEYLSNHRGEMLQKITPAKLDEQDYCMLANVEKESAKCIFPMALCMPGRKNCKVMYNWVDVFDAVTDYISAHQDALDKIKEYLDRIERCRDKKKDRGKKYEDKDPRVKKWLLGITRGRNNRDVLLLKRERAGLLPRRIAQLSRMAELRACVIVVSKKRADKATAFKLRNLRAKARKLLPSLRFWQGLGM